MIALLRGVRPAQWVKNLLVAAAPLASGRIGEPDVLLAVAVAFLAFCAAASAVYLVNDVHDAEQDRRHPTKRERPVAAGELSPTLATAAAALLAAAAVAGAALLDRGLAAVVVTYLVIQVSYAYGLKHQPVLDLACVAAGFGLRAVAGGVAADIALSPLFLLVSAFGSLFIVAGKRYSELHTLGADAGTRRSLQYYSASYLRFVWGMAASVTVVAYSLWAFGGARGVSQLGTTSWDELSVVPFVLGLLRYSVDIDRGTAGTPEDIVFGDRVLQVLGLVWMTTVLVAVYR